MKIKLVAGGPITAEEQPGAETVVLEFYVSGDGCYGKILDATQARSLQDALNRFLWNLDEHERGKGAVHDASQVLIEHLKAAHNDFNTPPELTWCTQEYPVEGKLSDGGPFWRVHVSLEPDSLALNPKNLETNPLK